MSDEPKPGLLDRLVAGLAAAMNAVGLNGRRLLWRWEIRKRELAEGRAQAGNVLRGARAKHRMCPECRTLVPRDASHCTDCGQPMARVSRPGAGRLLANLLPGTTSVTSWLTLAIGLMFLVELLYATRYSPEGVGILGGDFDTLVALGMAGPLQFWWRLPTAVFLHAGIIHLAFNTLALVRLGPLVEREIGPEPLWILFLSSGVAGNVLAGALHGRGVVGASGAIFGLVGAIVMFGRRLGHAGSFYRSLIAQNALPLIIINFLPFVSWQAHLGGFLAGMALGGVLPLGAKAASPRGAWQAGSLAAVGLVLYCFYRVSTGG